MDIAAARVGNFECSIQVSTDATNASMTRYPPLAAAALCKSARRRERSVREITDRQLHLTPGPITPVDQLIDEAFSPGLDYRSITYM